MLLLGILKGLRYIQKGWELDLFSAMPILLSHLVLPRVYTILLSEHTAWKQAGWRFLRAYIDILLTHTYIRINMRIGGYTYTFMHTYIHTVHTDRQTDRRTDRQTYVHACMHAYIHTYTHTHIYIDTYTYIHIHTDRTNRQTDRQTHIQS